MKTTLRQIDKALEAIAIGHKSVADYFWGDWPDSFESRVQKYPAVVCNVQTPVTFTKITTITLNVIVADQISANNLKEVESDTLQILHDFYRVLKHSPNWKEFAVVETARSDLKFKDRSPDEVAGWQGTYTLKLIESQGLCDLPLSNYDYNQKINC